MKIVAVVPMKLNNERLPGKNTKKMYDGTPLCNFILNTLCDVKFIDEIYVYCSDESIKKYLPDKVKFLKRPSEFDTSSTKMNEILSSFDSKVQADIYLMTHVTSPFVKKESIESALEKVIYEDYDSAFAVKKVQDFLWKDGHPMNYDFDNIPRTQDLPIIYQETSGFYIYESQVIKKYNRRIGFKPYLQEVNEIEALDIDEDIEFKIADAVYSVMERREN